METLYPSITIKRNKPVNFNSENKTLFNFQESNNWPIYYQPFDNMKVNHELFVKKKHQNTPDKLWTSVARQKIQHPTISFEKYH